jgi:ATP-GRASP peptide maturase of grasp-with-spasm system
MILLICDSYEPSIDEVIDWLVYNNKPFARINTTDLIESVDLKINEKGERNIILRHSGIKIDFEQITFYWYKRGNLKLKQTPINCTVENFRTIMDAQISWELYGLEHYINTYLKTIPHIGSFFDNAINKPEVLYLAGRVGLSIPETLITSERESAINFCEKHHNKIITKSIRNGYYLEVGDVRYYTHTLQIQKAAIQEFPERFVPALFQEMLDKKYELRIFYLDGHCYSSVIFSQNDPKTKIDFRNYNSLKPNRVCPYKLPTDIEHKLHQLMKHLGMMSGSIDMVVTKNQEYKFLEINPVGQFKQVSLPCNYKLEKRMAARLSETI